MDPPELDVVLLLARGQLGDGGRDARTGAEGTDAPWVYLDLNVQGLVACAPGYSAGCYRTLVTLKYMKDTDN